MAIDKQHILDEIKRVAKVNGGESPGIQRFKRETGIKKSDWYPDHWLRWGDALIEAGFSPNEMDTAWTPEALLEKYIDLIRKLGHFPLEGKVRRQSKKPPAFPSHTSFGRFGGKSNLAAAIIEYSKSRSGFADIIDICSKVASINVRSAKTERESANEEALGFVYLIKSGRHYKIGRTNAIGRRQYELAIQLPEKTNTVHVIKTDDPAGIEAYWHKRFEPKRGNGEWFDLTRGYQSVQTPHVHVALHDLSILTLPRHPHDLCSTMSNLRKAGRAYGEGLMAKSNIFKIFNEVIASNLAHSSLTASVLRTYSRSRLFL